MKTKFVSAAKPTDYADQLHAIQLEARRLIKRLKELEAREKLLAAYLRKFAKDQTFVYDASDGYEKVVKFGEHERFILDVDRVRRLLRSRTPYKKSTWMSVKVDYVYVSKGRG